MIAKSPHQLFVIESDTLSNRLARRANLRSTRMMVAQNLVDFVAQFRAHPGGIGLLDIAPPERSDEQISFQQKLQTAHSLSRIGNSKIFAITGLYDQHLRQELLKIGFAAVFYSISQHSRLSKMAIKHFNSSPVSKASIEESVTRNLPWNP